MINAREELLEHVNGREVEYVKIKYDHSYESAIFTVEGTLEAVLPFLDFDYDDGYGCQELYGYIWYKDGTWSSRGEYDGSEWWVHNARPDINDPI